ncbi:MAG TPA: histidine kinase N-terminal 7TM domain-containing protein, partial [Anaerolineaceae bacterium]|nr:histidine kinase N-terminal 7TM domain-containing protein [Anaerolineaceae bacterium]
IILILTTLVAIFIAWEGWQRRRVPGARYLAYLQIAIAVWALGGVFEAAATGLETKVMWAVFSYPGVAFAPLMYFFFAWDFVQQEPRLKSRTISLLLIMPLITIAMALTNGLHGWLWPEVTMLPDSNVAIYGHGPYFYFNLLFAYSLMVVASVVLWRFVLRFPPFYAKQALSLTAASVFPILGSILYVSGANPLPGLDWTPVGFGLSGLALVLGIRKYRVLDIAPIPADQLIQNIPDGVLVLDAQSRIVQINLAAQHMLAKTSEMLVGKNAREVLINLPLQALKPEMTIPSSIEMLLDWYESRYVDVRITPLSDQRGRSMGRLILLRDVSLRKRSEEELRRANERLTSQLARIEQLQERLREEAVHDPLTGAYNRRYLEQILAQELLVSETQKRAMSVAMLDIDHFKQFNDRMGHKAGDMVLQKLTEVLQLNTRHTDTVCRYGGDEFVVVLPGANAEVASRRAETWRSTFEKTMPTYEDQTFQVTISVGVVEYMTHGLDAESLLRMADRSLYAAKDAGTNCVVVAGRLASPVGEKKTED